MRLLEGYHTIRTAGKYTYHVEGFLWSENLIYELMVVDGKP